MVSFTLKNRFMQMIGAGSADVIRYIDTVHENQTVTLPRDVVEIKVMSGTAWVSHQMEDVVLYAGQTLKLQPNRDIAVVTSAGRRPATLELTR